MGEYLVTHRFDNIADNATTAMLVKVDADKELVFGISFDAPGTWDVTIYEGPTLNDVGTLLSAIDTDRQAASSPDSLFYHTPNVAINGTLILDGTAGVVEPVPSIPRGSGPFILKADEDYVIYAINRSGVAADIGYRIACTEALPRS